MKYICTQVVVLFVAAVLAEKCIVTADCGNETGGASGPR